jgi:hypothetical protein
MEQRVWGLQDNPRKNGLLAKVGSGLAVPSRHWLAVKRSRRRVKLASPLCSFRKMVMCLFGHAPDINWLGRDNQKAPPGGILHVTLILRNRRSGHYPWGCQDRPAF